MSNQIAIIKNYNIDLVTQIECEYCQNKAQTICYPSASLENNDTIGLEFEVDIPEGWSRRHHPSCWLCPDHEGMTHQAWCEKLKNAQET